MSESQLKIRGWSVGAMVLGKLPVPGRPTNLDNSRARAYCACSRCGWGVVWTFFLSILSLLFLPLSVRCAMKTDPSRKKTTFEKNFFLF